MDWHILIHLFFSLLPLELYDLPLSLTFPYQDPHSPGRSIEVHQYCEKNNSSVEFRSPKVQEQEFPYIGPKVQEELPYIGLIRRTNDYDLYDLDS